MYSPTFVSGVKPLFKKASAGCTATVSVSKMKFPIL